MSENRRFSASGEKAAGAESRNRASSAAASGNPPRSAPRRAPGVPAPDPRRREGRLPGQESGRLTTTAESRSHGSWRPGNGASRDLRRGASESRRFSASGERGCRRGVSEPRVLGFRVRESVPLGASPRTRRPGPGPAPPRSPPSGTGIQPIADNRRFPEPTQTMLWLATPVHRPQREPRPRPARRARGRPPPSPDSPRSRAR